MLLKPKFYGLLDTFNRPPAICSQRYDTLCRVEIEEKAKDLNEIQGKYRYIPIGVFEDGSFAPLSVLRELGQ